MFKRHLVGDYRFPNRLIANRSDSEVWGMSGDLSFNRRANTSSKSHPHRWTNGLYIYIYLALFCGLLPTHTQAIKWLGIYRLPRGADHPVDSKADRFTSAECHTASVELGLRRRQSWFCNHPKFGFAMLAVLRAAHAVGYHCPKAFADRRWNCTSVNRLPEVSPELKRGTREQALVHAFSSAALLFEIGRYCALNKIRFCSCDDESAAQPIGDMFAGQNPHLNPDGALIYQSGAEASNMMPMMPPVPSNANPIADGQSTVSRYYWAGCSDNIRVAREYVAAFLGISIKRIMQLPTMPIDNTDQLRDLDDLNTERYTRSAEISRESTGEFVRTKRDTNQPWMYQPQASDFGHYQHSNIYSGSQRRPPLSPINLRDMRRPQSDQNWRRRSEPNEPRSRAQILRILDKHNYLAGVVLMEANHKLVCKCHGVSGSCVHRVCFRQLRRIDDELMQKALKLRYLSAKQVRLGNRRQLIAKSFTGAGFVDEVVKPSELVFSEHSPDYCNVEPHRGSVGTHGRKCTLTNTGTAHCLNMCCGRGYTNITTQELVQCNCRMGEGFKVKCDECRQEIVTQQCI